MFFKKNLYYVINYILVQKYIKDFEKNNLKVKL